MYPTVPHVKIAQQILDAPVKEDDIWLISYPRTGSTWCQEMIWLLANNLDFETARNTIQQLRAPMLEMSTVLFRYHDFLGTRVMNNSVEFVNNIPSPRCIKSHLPWPLLPTQLDTVKPKIVYTCRNPKDVCVSYFHYSRSVQNFQAPFEEFCDMFINGLLPIGPIFAHYLDFWNRRHEPNVLFLTYENMIKDLRGAVQKVATFLNKNYNEEDYNMLCDYLSFQKMKDNDGCNRVAMLESVFGKKYFKETGSHFIRKGQVGDWKNHITGNLAKKFDSWIKESTKGTGLNFD